MSDTLLTVGEVAARLGKSAIWVRRQAFAGTIPCRRIGRSYAFTEADYDDYLASTRKGARAVQSEGFAARSRRRSA